MLRALLAFIVPDVQVVGEINSTKTSFVLCLVNEEVQEADGAGILSIRVRLGCRHQVPIWVGAQSPWPRVCYVQARERDMRERERGNTRGENRGAWRRVDLLVIGGRESSSGHGGSKHTRPRALSHSGDGDGGSWSCVSSRLGGVRS
ncbi:hypothetical protein D1007_04611 [Hordeum vulgare]|nr:hypothetical protein D1007_04611 [Hordeum vulgare]